LTTQAPPLRQSRDTFGGVQLLSYPENHSVSEVKVYAILRFHWLCCSKVLKYSV